MRQPFTAVDLRNCVELSGVALCAVPQDQWDEQPSNSDWTRRRILRHLTWAILGYASLLALEEDYGPIDFLLLEDRDDPVTYTVNRLKIAAELLIAVARGVEPTARGWHPHGRPDAEGFLAMAGSELTMHVHDVVLDPGVKFRPQDDVVDRLLKRLYPWAPAETPRWQTLLWVTGRAELPGHEMAGSDWRMFSAPLDEWNGEVWRRPPDYKLPDTGRPPIFQ